MIKKEIKVGNIKNVVCIEFGYGDILVGSVVSIEEEYCGVALTNHESRPIGEIRTTEKGETTDNTGIDVLISFTKVESLDVLLGHLLKTRETLIDMLEMDDNNVKTKEYWEGFDYALQLLDDMYANNHPHKFNIADCIKAKVNRLDKENIRTNKK